VADRSPRRRLPDVTQPPPIPRERRLPSESMRPSILQQAKPHRAWPGAVESLGAGWVADEALAIAVYCALAAEAARGEILRVGMLMAVNHGGDRGGTGSIAGNLLGAAVGVEAIPPEWLDGLEGAAVIRQVACDLYDTFVGGAPIDVSCYPTW